METMTFRQSALTATALLMSFATFAQEEKQFEIAPSADLVSSYVWRGVYQTGASVQPSINLSYAGFSLTAWGSTDFSSLSDPDKGKEFDLTIGYGIGGFSIGVTDYWWAGEGHRYGDYSNSHFFEGTAGYNFGESFPLGITWSTMFAGGDKKADGRPAVLYLRRSGLRLQRIGCGCHPEHRSLPLDRNVPPRGQRRLRPLHHRLQGQ